MSLQLRLSFACLSMREGDGKVTVLGVFFTGCTSIFFQWVGEKWRKNRAKVFYGVMRPATYVGLHHATLLDCRRSNGTFSEKTRGSRAWIHLRRQKNRSNTGSKLQAATNKSSKTRGDERKDPTQVWSDSVFPVHAYWKPALQPPVTASPTSVPWCAPLLHCTLRLVF